MKKLLLVTLVLLAIIFISSSVIVRIILGYRGYRIPTDAMAPTILKGNHIVVNTRAYLKELPKRGDIVIFNLPDYPRKMFIKRIIALPREKI